jgi:hypothetical protein
MENFDLEVQLEDLTIHHDDNSDQSIDSWKTGLELSKDDNLIFSSHNSKFDNRCQILTIAEDNSEELDDNNNPVLNLANINRGANHLAEGETADSLATRVKVDYQKKNGEQSIQPWSTTRQYQQTLAKTCSWGTITP